MLINCVAYQNGTKLADISVEAISDYVGRPLPHAPIPLNFLRYTLHRTGTRYWAGHLSPAPGVRDEVGRVGHGKVETLGPKFRKQLQAVAMIESGPVLFEIGLERRDVPRIRVRRRSRVLRWDFEARNTGRAVTAITALSWAFSQLAETE